MGRRRGIAQKGSVWWIRLIFVPLGILVVVGGWNAFRHGSFWILGDNPQMGTLGITPTLSFVFMGLLFIAIGLIPWERIKK